MIVVQVIKQRQKIVDVVINGHANYADKGEDLVCAGVSAVSIGVCETLYEHGYMNHGEIIVDEGYVHIFSKKSTDEQQLILETLLTSLRKIEEAYSPYIEIHYKEE